MTVTKSIALVGARGHTGRELLRLIAQHPVFHLVAASSRELAGKPVSDLAPEIEGIEFSQVNPDDLASLGADSIVLALPDKAGQAFMEEAEKLDPQPVVLDLSADKRFDETWRYGLPELYLESQESSSKLISNPGCYATAAQLGIFPLKEFLVGIPSVFGVSGYSGAGKTPSPKNDVNRLKDNLMPYALTGHKHEKEVSHHLGTKVRFTPHVHPAFEGLTCTIHIPLDAQMSEDELFEYFCEFYKKHALVKVQKEAPELKDGTKTLGAIIGGFALSEDKKHAVIVVAQNNLLKGAAVQAIQNLNIAFGLSPLTGL